MQLPCPIIVKETSDEKQFNAGDQTLLRELLHPQNDSLNLPYSLAHAELAPGSCSLPHRLVGSDELYYFLNGEGRLHVDDEAFEVKPGTLVLVPANAKQHLENTSQGQLTFLCIVSPPWSEGEEVIE